MRPFSLSMLAIGLLALSACDAALADGLPEAEANRIVIALDGAGISAIKEKAEGGGEEVSYTIVVASDDVPRALAVLRSSDLPQREERGLAETFHEGGLVPTATEERARYVAALGADLGRSIAAMNGVLSARVHIALPEHRDLPLEGPLPHPRASVLVRHRAGSAPNGAEIRSLVAGAVQGMTAEDVALVLSPAAAAESPRSELVRVGPIAVSRGTSFALKAILGGSVALNALLAALLVFMALRKPRPTEEAASAPVPAR